MQLRNCADVSARAPKLHAAPHADFCGRLYMRLSLRTSPDFSAGDPKLRAYDPFLLGMYRLKITERGRTVGFFATVLRLWCIMDVY
jgi:hypothetical protein